MANTPWIHLRGGAEHNLRSIDADVPIHRLTVVCGVSGSGKTSLAIDTLFAEGQRRYIESFSAYTRQFLARIEKPSFDALENLPPSLAISRSDRGRNNRSTVGTSSEVMEPLRVLFSQVSTLNCRGCGQPVIAHTPPSVLGFLRQLPEHRALVGFGFTWSSKASLSEQLFEFQSSGFVRMVVNDQLVEFSDERASWAKRIKAKGSAVLVVDRFRAGPQVSETSLLASLELCFRLSENGIIALVEEPDEPSDATTQTIDGKRFREYRFSSGLRCDACGIDYPRAEPRLFNFNSPIGACPTCTGFGEVAGIDKAKIVPDPELSLRDGAIAPWRTPSYAHELEELLALADDYGVPVDIPVSKLSKKHWELVQRGVPERRFGGLDGFFAWLERKKYKMHVRAFLARWRTYATCPDCQGARLSPDALSYLCRGEHFSDWCNATIESLVTSLRSIASDAKAHASSSWASIQAPMEEVLSRLEYLHSVGLGYVTLSRTMHTLSGGEAQRVLLTTLLGSDLVDMLYVLDEPTVGLHPCDTERVAEAITKLVERGNTVLLIEHEPYLLFRADHVLEIGPGAGERGGTVCYSGPPSGWETAGTLTSKYLFESSACASLPRPLGKRWITLSGANGRTLKGDTLKIPTGVLTAVIGVSGSGKSSLVLDTLVPAALRSFGDSEVAALPFDGLHGLEGLEGCVAIDQSPIMKSIRSTPATYTKAMDEIRSVFGALPESRARGLEDGHFSFNSASGRCPECEGLGFTVVDMQFMADVRLECPMCRGKRYKPEVLQVKYRDKNIADILAMSVESGQSFFRGERKLQQRLQPLIDIGLGYLPLGQSVAALSAGESMRLKLASHLQDRQRHLIVMDEPTTGLHFADVDRLLQCIGVLLDHGNTVLVVEHNEQIIRSADYLVELGPGAGPDGGRILKVGPRDTFFAEADTPTIRALTAKRDVPTANS